MPSSETLFLSVNKMPGGKAISRVSPNGLPLYCVSVKGRIGQEIHLGIKPKETTFVLSNINIIILGKGAAWKSIECTGNDGNITLFLCHGNEECLGIKLFTDSGAENIHWGQKCHFLPGLWIIPLIGLKEGQVEFCVVSGGKVQEFTEFSSIFIHNNSQIVMSEWTSGNLKIVDVPIFERKVSNPFCILFSVKHIISHSYNAVIKANKKRINLSFVAEEIHNKELHDDKSGIVMLMQDQSWRKIICNRYGPCKKLMLIFGMCGHLGISLAKGRHRKLLHGSKCPELPGFYLVTSESLHEGKCQFELVRWPDKHCEYGFGEFGNGMMRRVKLNDGPQLIVARWGCMNTRIIDIPVRPGDEQLPDVITIHGKSRRSHSKAKRDERRERAAARTQLRQPMKERYPPHPVWRKKTPVPPNYHHPSIRHPTRLSIISERSESSNVSPVNLRPGSCSGDSMINEQCDQEPGHFQLSKDQGDDDFVADDESSVHGEQSYEDLQDVDEVASRPNLKRFWGIVAHAVFRFARGITRNKQPGQES